MRRFVGLPFTTQVWQDLLYLITGFLLGAVALAILLVGPLTGAVLALTVVGLPWLYASLAVCERFAALERGRAKLALGRPIAGPGPLQLEGSMPRRLRRMLGASRTWREIGHLVLMPWIALGTVLVGLGALVGALSILAAPAWMWAIPGGVHFGLFTIDSVMWGIPLALLAGPPLTLVGFWAVHGCALVQARTTRVLLGYGAHERIVALESSRAGAVDAAASELRRIERDLHDGAQARLVNLAMDLGMARERLATDPEAAAVLLEEAHREAKTALTELRDLARGIHPAILTDRGLDAAVSALAARCPVPCAVRIDTGGRLPAHVESAAYFTISEALTNIAKHSGARRCDVLARREDGRLIVEVRDDGHGGALPGHGTGIAGLRGRVEAQDGQLTVMSPEGGGTVLRAELPCAS